MDNHNLSQTWAPFYIACYCLVTTVCPVYWNPSNQSERENGSLQAETKSTRVRNRLGALLVRLTPTERQRLLVVTIIIGGVCGLVAVSFHVGIDMALAFLINRALSVPNISWIFWSILTPAIGGLFVGLALLFLLLTFPS